MSAALTRGVSVSLSRAGMRAKCLGSLSVVLVSSSSRAASQSVSRAHAGDVFATKQREWLEGKEF